MKHEDDQEIFHQALEFVGDTPAKNNDTGVMSAVDNDIFSWMMLNGNELFPGASSVSPQALNRLQSSDSLMGFSNGPVSPKHPPVKQRCVKAETSAPDVKLTVSTQKLSGEEKLQVRREKQKLIARNFRKRKKERLSELEDQVASLQNQNAQLQKQIKFLQNPDTASSLASEKKLLNKNEENRLSQLQELRRILHDMKKFPKPSESDSASCKQRRKAREEQWNCRMRSILAQHTAQFADFGNSRKADVRFHIDQLKRLLLPSMVTKMCVWTLDKEDDFYTGESSVESTSPETTDTPTPRSSSAPYLGLWDMLCKQMDLSELQQKTILAKRDRVKEQREDIPALVALIEQLDARVFASYNRRKLLLEDIMNVMRPDQLTRFIIWIEDNEACMHMLSYLWKKNSKAASQRKRKRTDSMEKESAELTSVTRNTVFEVGN